MQFSTQNCYFKLKRDVIRQHKLLKFKAEAKVQNPQTTTAPFLALVPPLKCTIKCIQVEHLPQHPTERDRKIPHKIQNIFTAWVKTSNTALSSSILTRNTGQLEYFIL